MRRKIHKCLSFLLAAVLLASLAAPAALAAEGGDTVFVRTAEDLVQLAENCTLDSWSQGRIVRLEADIDLSGTDFTPIPTFGGTFEGQGHTISGLSITGSGNVRGLFRYIQPSGVVRDLSVEGRVDPSDRKNTLGGIAGSNRGLLAGCTFHGTVRGADSIGGLVGINESSGQIVNCTFSGAVTGEHYAGGIAGQNYGAGEYERLKKGVRVSVAMTACFTVLLSTAFFLLARPLLAIFSPDPDVLEVGVEMVRFLAPCYITYILIELLTGAIRGAGKSVAPMLISVFGVCGLRLLWLFTVVPAHHTLLAVEASYPITWAVTSVAILLYYRFGRWLHPPKKA